MRNKVSIVSSRSFRSLSYKWILAYAVIDCYFINIIRELMQFIEGCINLFKSICI